MIILDDEYTAGNRFPVKYIWIDFGCAGKYPESFNIKVRSLLYFLREFGSQITNFPGSTAI